MDPRPQDYEQLVRQSLAAPKPGDFGRAPLREGVVTRFASHRDGAEAERATGLEL